VELPIDESAGNPLSIAFNANQQANTSGMLLVVRIGLASQKIGHSLATAR
jgi:hypothetical protein